MTARPVLFAVVGISFFLQSLPARPGRPEAGGVERLHDRSLKVRLQAAILMGNQQVTRAAPVLRKLLLTEREHAAVRAAAAASLGRLGDEKARPRLVVLLGHPNRLLARAAEKALRLLDEKGGRPAFLVAVARAGVPPDVPLDRARILEETLRRELENTAGLVLGSGEDRVLSAPELKTHLYRRGLRGLLLEPQLVDLTTRIEPDSARIFGTTRIRVLGLVDQNTEFVGIGEADAWVADPDISDAERIMLESQVLDDSLDAALTEVLDFLSAP